MPASSFEGWGEKYELLPSFRRAHKGVAKSPQPHIPRNCSDGVVYGDGKMLPPNARLMPIEFVFVAEILAFSVDLQDTFIGQP